jgi:2-polyprenyl-3-methyl-5-hydroxy-6-metoxy-1,4-benzoquinol methylase
MSDNNRRDHWEAVYSSKAENEVSWFQENPALSLELLELIGTTPTSSVIDIGGGASRLVDGLIHRAYLDVTVLDLSEAALDAAKLRLGDTADRAGWIVADVTTWQPQRAYDVWHDRAAFHFLTEESERAAYVTRLASGVKPGGHVIIATFALNGPEKCSGLPVIRYSPETLGRMLGPTFQLVETREQTHSTPWKSEQYFQASVFRHI